MRAFLTRFYDAMANEISLAGGTVEKFAGDAVMAVFGVPEALEDHVERALHAALAMQRRTGEVLGLGLDLRIGINTGEIVVGSAREGSSIATGIAVNVAARLEQAADSGGILVGERTVALAAGAFEFGPLQRVEAKGIAGGVACRRLVRALTLMRPRGVPGRPPAFVGREEELGRLHAAFERVRTSRRPELVTIVGAPGVGKTRIVRELWASLGAEEPGALRRTGRCLPYGHARTYAPVAEILKEQFGILDGDSPERALALLGSREILALTLGIDVAGDLHPMDARAFLHDTWVELVAELAAEQPLVLLVEDLHWAEPPLLDLLERTLGEVAGPVLLLATGRQEFLDRTPTWGRGRVPAEWIWLEPLSDDEVDRWLVDIGAGEAPATVREALAQAEGNPLFLEELVATLIANGVLGDDGWDVARLPRAVDLPDTVQAVLAARIDALPATERAALQAAAVIGRTFWPSAVRELVGDEPDFAVLEQRDFVHRRPGSSLEGDRELVIKHALTREVALGSLSRRERVAPARRIRGLARGSRRWARRGRGNAGTPLRGRSAAGRRRPCLERRARALRGVAGVCHPLVAAGGGAGDRPLRDRRCARPQQPRSRARGCRAPPDRPARRARAHPERPVRHRASPRVARECSRARSGRRNNGMALRAPRRLRPRSPVPVEAATLAGGGGDVAGQGSRAVRARLPGLRLCESDAGADAAFGKRGRCRRGAGDRRDRRRPRPRLDVGGSACRRCDARPPLRRGASLVGTPSARGGAAESRPQRRQRALHRRLRLRASGRPRRCAPAGRPRRGDHRFARAP